MNRRSTPRRRMLGCILTVATALLASCSRDSTSPASTTTVQTTARSIVVDGLDRPTQIIDGPNGLLLVAQLAGDENDATGEVLAVDVATGHRQVIADTLDKPTGVLWADGAFVYETSGALTNGEAGPGSGPLSGYDPADHSSRAIATGLKNAYGHAVLDDGRILTTEIGDNITDPPVEEVDVIDPNQMAPDFGWPDCPRDTACADVVGPLAIFPVASTPTGVAAIGDDVYVALFVTGQLLHVTLAGWKVGSTPASPTEILC